MAEHTRLLKRDVELRGRNQKFREIAFDSHCLDRSVWIERTRYATIVLCMGLAPLALGSLRGARERWQRRALQNAAARNSPICCWFDGDRGSPGQKINGVLCFFTIEMKADSARLSGGGGAASMLRLGPALCRSSTFGTK